MLIIGIDEMRTFARDKGVTLMELLTVIAIIGMMAAITLPAFHLMARGHKLNSSAKLITDTLSSARGLAITHRRTHYVEFDDDSARQRIRIFYVVEGGDISNPDDRETVGEWKDLPEPIVFMDQEKVSINPPDLIYRWPPDYVQFKANGGASGGSMGFTIIDPTTYDGNPPFNDTGLLQKSKTCHITVINVTGRVKATFE